MTNSFPEKEIYEYWHELYYLLATLPLNDESFRKSPELLSVLKKAKWGVDENILENYWRRVKWVANNSSSSVLEIGSGMGNITRWIAENPRVSLVVAVDLLPTYVQTLNSFGWKKVVAYCTDLNKDLSNVSQHAPFDTVVLSEVIEHLSTDQEICLLRSIRPLLSRDSKFVLTTPINYMTDPDHVRGFRRFHFKLRCWMLYGTVLSSEDNSMQQFAAGRFQLRPMPLIYLSEVLVKLTDYCLEIRPSGHPWKMPSIIYAALKNFIRKVVREK